MKKDLPLWIIAAILLAILFVLYSVGKDVQQLNYYVCIDQVDQGNIVGPRGAQGRCK